MHYGDRTIYGWCAADTLSVSRVLDRTVEIESADPVTGRKIEIIASPAGIERMDPEGVAMSMICWDLADKDGTRSSQEIRANACDYIFFFESVKTAEQWVAEHPATAVLTPDEIFELVRVAFEPPIEDLLMGQI